MKKILLTLAFASFGFATIQAQTQAPAKKTQTEQTDKKDCKKECTKDKKECKDNKDAKKSCEKKCTKGEATKSETKK